MFFNAQRKFGFIFTLLLQYVSYSTSQLPDTWDTVCQIDALSFGFNDSTTFNGYVDINGKRVISTTSQAANQGFNTLELDVTSCSASNIQRFNTYSSTNDSDNMATYIRNLPLYTVLIGVTADEASQSLNQNAKSALLDIGVNATGLAFLGKMSFVAQIGQPAMTVMQIGPAGGNNVKITVNFTEHCRIISENYFTSSKTLLLNGQQYGCNVTLLQQSVIYSTSHVLNDTDCVVNALSWGLQDTTIYEGYVSVGKNVASIPKIIGKGTNSNFNKGFYIVELDVNNCSTLEVHQFDTSLSITNSMHMAAYINSLPISTVLIGVTFDDASQHLESSGINALLSIGVNVTGLEYGGKVAFVAEVGQPALTVMKMGPPGGDNVRLTWNGQACVVNALSWGYSDTSSQYNGYISVSETTPGAKITNQRGFNIFELDLINCSTSDVHHFDTAWPTTNDSINMANYINALPITTVLIGVTSDDASKNLDVNGENALLSIGVNVTGLEVHGKVAFVAQVGRPALTVQEMGPSFGDNLVLQLKIPANPCKTNPCLNGGKCLAVGLSYWCFCGNGYAGINCEAP